MAFMAWPSWHGLHGMAFIAWPSWHGLHRMAFMAWILHDLRVIITCMKNITITLDDETANWARVCAAQQNKSLSRFLGELLHNTMRDSHAYEEAMQRYLSKGPFPLSGDTSPYPKREELYDRGELR
jgi:hypothetical protein